MRDMENLYVIAIEECAELQQEITKLMRFGNDHQAKMHLLTKFYQLQSVMDLIICLEDMDHTMSEDQITQIKAEKILKAIEETRVSRHLGIIINGGTRHE